MKQRAAALALLVVALAIQLQAEPNRWRMSLPGENAHAVAIDPLDPAIAYAATSTGILKTTDRGRHWTLVETFPEANAIAINPRNPANVVAGHAGTWVHVGTSSGHIRVSEDGGATWSEIRLAPYADTVTALVFDPSKPATVYASLLGSGVAKSTDGGRTWMTSIQGLLCCVWDFFDTLDIVIGAGDTPALYAASGRALYRSDDDAQLWRYAPLTPAAGGPDFFENRWRYFEPWNLAVAPSDPKRLYVTGYQQPHFGPLTITSGDGGVTWQVVPLRSIGINRIAIDPRLPATLYAASSYRGFQRSPDGMLVEMLGQGVLRSRDGGLTWASFNEGLPERDVASISVDSSGTLIYASTPAGVFVYEVSAPERRRIVSH